MLLANKHFTPVLGIDIHIVILLGVPTPLPHPFIGMVMDPMDYIPFIGSTVNVNSVPKGNSQTAGMLGTYFHIPMGGPFLMAPMIGHDSMNFFGSTTVNAEDNYFSPSGHMLMTCSDIGMPLSLTPGKKMRPIPSMYLPTSMSIPLPMGKTVMVGGPYAPDLLGLLMGLVMSYGFGSLMKIGGKALKKLNHGVLKKFKSTEGLSKKLCKMGFEPVDLVTGRMVYDGEDFTIPGPIPIQWERNWYSDSGYEGLMGHGFHSNYDLSLHLVPEEDAIVLRLPDGRVTAMPMLYIPEEEYYNRQEKLTLRYVDKYTYELEDKNTSLTYVYKKRTPNLYKPAEIINADGFKLALEYNSANALTAIQDSVGRILELALDQYNRVTNIQIIHKGKIRQLLSYGYNKEGDLIRITDAVDQHTLMEYENHLMVKKTDRNGQAFYWKYDGKKTGAKCIETWGDGDILSGTLEYRKNYNIITNSLGAQTIYYFNNLNLCTQVTDPLGGHIFHEYTEFMEPYRDIDEEGNITGYSYDQKGNLTSIHQPDGAVVTFVYDEKDRLVLTKYPVGGAIVRSYKKDKLHAVIGTDGGVTSFDYNDKGLIKEVRDNAGNISELVYDADYNLAQMHLPNEAVAEWEYDAWGRCIKIVNAEGYEESFVYDDLDRVRQVVEPDHNQILLKYNAYDEVTEMHQRNGKVKFEYTPMGSLKMREERGRKVFFNYDTEEQLRYIDNEHGERYRYKRNANGAIVQEIGFDGLTRIYQRDRAGKVQRINRPEGRFTDYEYDNNGRITRAEHSDGNWETYSYNQNGQLIEAVNLNTKVQFIRNASGAVVAEYQDGHLVKSSYDNLGNRTKISSSLGADITFDRNKIGQIEAMNAQLNVPEEANVAPNITKVATPWAVNFAYDSVGMEVERMLPGGIKATKKYDEAGRPIQHVVTRGRNEMRHRTYAWNANDRLSRMVNQLTQGQVTYSYDNFGSLATAKYENHDMDYKLPDEVGNLYRNKNQTDRKYNSGGQLAEANGTKYHYDEEGNIIVKQTPKGTFKYQWYGNGMLKAVERPDQQTISFEYDALGRRTAKIDQPKFGNQGIITRFVWDGNVPLHEWRYKLKNRPDLVVDEFGLLSTSKPEPIENLITWVFDENSFKPAAKITEEDTYSIITDYLGTPVEMYNSKGEKTWQVEYDIYGKVRKLVTGSLADCPFRYQGQYEDVETGLYYNRFRYYSPDSGTYISQDPIGLAGGMPNMYSYVNDSNNWIDPLGLMGIGAWGEKVASKYLANNGHTILGSVQNASGHGFDLVTKTLNGDINIIEVKTSKSNWRSKSNMSKWTNNNIGKISGNTNGRWKNMPDYQKNLMSMIDDAKQNGKLKNKLLQINIDKRKIRLKCKS
ncbi:RHS domain-containing protein [Cellulophaga baltica]|uniref:RHS repeat-associated core domain-containing protein n=1 Tax=Cellulophaga TaxID=104264 RepID=UPI001C07EDBE|nr:MULTISPECIES: RHS repeat-associated core domain-containing protein [Cellulophaga]MBU2998082.1 RHS domain-containing protein [Cellulophaga baltica]MDO6769484.1 RHS repeat-associated core domain-containing protein [Cellulophaga sp. 1_MG-2023]